MSALVLLLACGDDGGDGTCELGTSEGCDEVLVCEAVAGGDPACFAPVFVEGRVFDTATDGGIGDARVVALDVNGGARSTVVFSAADGSYRLPVPAERDAEGNPTSDRVTLRVAAQGYQRFPTAPRQALPLELADAAMDGETGDWVLMNAATDVGLVGLPGGAAGLATIEGVVEADDPGGVLVVAVQGEAAVSTAVTDTDGGFRLHNVPAGTTALEGYRLGLAVTPETVEVAGAPVTGVVLAGSTEGLGAVEGDVNIVDGGGAGETSVILGLESTFDETAARAEVPAGLRVGGVSGAFSFTDVPPGRYVVLAAFENDGLVRDPDEGIAGTDIVRIEVMAGDTVSLDTAFKVTGALATVSPGADSVETVTAAPTLEWADDSSEDGYEVELFDAFGELVEEAEVPGVSGSATVTHMVGATLEAGMIYQFRARSFRDSPSGDRSYISATEDLRGVFLYAP